MCLFLLGWRWICREGCLSYYMFVLLLCLSNSLGDIETVMQMERSHGKGPCLLRMIERKGRDYIFNCCRRAFTDTYTWMGNCIEASRGSIKAKRNREGRLLFYLYYGFTATSHFVSSSQSSSYIISIFFLLFLFIGCYDGLGFFKLLWLVAVSVSSLSCCMGVVQLLHASYGSVLLASYTWAAAIAVDIQVRMLFLWCRCVTRSTSLALVFSLNPYLE